MHDALKLTLDIAIAVFIGGALFTAGLEVTFEQVLQPLKNRSLVSRALLANLVLTPLVVYAMKELLPLERSCMIGVLLYGFPSGAPYTPRLVSIARGDVPISIGLAMLLTVLTILYMPIVLPFLVPGTEIGPWEIARPLLLQMFVPLTVGLVVRRLSEKGAEWLSRPANLIVNSSAVVFLVLALVLHHEELLGMVGTGAIASAVVVTVAAFVVGYALGTNGKKGKVTLGLVTMARNIGVAATIATANFGDDPRVLMTIVVCMLVVVALAFPTAGLYFRNRLRASFAD